MERRFLRLARQLEELSRHQQRLLAAGTPGCLPHEVTRIWKKIESGLSQCRPHLNTSGLVLTEGVVPAFEETRVLLELVRTLAKEESQRQRSTRIEAW
eukprot:2933554-Karenia_brevis.AAC.1